MIRKRVTEFLAILCLCTFVPFACADEVQELHDAHQRGLGLIEQSESNGDELFRAGLALIRQAAEQNYAPAQYDMGVLYLNDEFGMKNVVIAEKWLRLAAEQGYRDACHNLGLMYCDGEGDAVPKNTREGLRWLARSAELGDVDDVVLLALMYADGDGRPVILEEAYKWLTLGTLMGVPVSEEPELVEVERKCQSLSVHARSRAREKALEIFARIPKNARIHQKQPE